MVFRVIYSCLCGLLVSGVSAAEWVSGVITFDVDLSKQAADEKVELWIPYAVSDAVQDISEVRIEGNYQTAAVYTDKTFQTPMLHARWLPGSSSRSLRYSFRATRHELVRPTFPAEDAPLNAAEHALYLRETTKAPLTPEVRALARQIVESQKGTLAKARALYDWTVENSYRNPNTIGCGAGDLCQLLKDPGGKCADISSLFIGLCRAAGIPAREVLGIRMGKKPVQDITGWQHCWAEFYLPGSGWISVDPADVRKKMLVENLPLDAPAIQSAREYFFGGVDAYRIQLSGGRDVELNPAAEGGAINYLMYPFAQVGGKTLNWLDPASFSYSIRYEALETPISQK